MIFTDKNSDVAVKTFFSLHAFLFMPLIPTPSNQNLLFIFYFFYSKCTGTRIELEWNKPKTYGDAMIEKYLLRLDNCDYADVSHEQNSYTFSMCEPGTTYTFQMQVRTFLLLFLNLLFKIFSSFLYISFC